jgi:hypothetical protein
MRFALADVMPGDEAIAAIKTQSATYGQRGEAIPRGTMAVDHLEGSSGSGAGSSPGPG